MRVQKPKHTLYIFLAVILCMVVCLVILKTGNTPEPVTMNVSLYKVVPDYDSFKKTISDRWKEKHPEVELNFENWDCYSGEVPEGLDVFVFDTISLDSFAEGMRAYIGYSEAMNEMGESASDMDFRLFSMTDSKNIPVFYVDAAAINAKISNKKRSLALDLLNIITGTDALTRAIANDSDPQYLLAARYSIYDAMASDYPLYEELKKIASVPDAFVFRIKPDGNDYLEEAEKNKDAMLPLMK